MSDLFRTPRHRRGTVGLFAGCRVATTVKINGFAVAAFDFVAQAVSAVRYPKPIATTARA
jgi:hypothetical protein